MKKMMSMKQKNEPRQMVSADSGVVEIAISVIFAILSAMALFNQAIVPAWYQAVDLAGTENGIATVVAELRLIIPDNGLLGLLGVMVLFFLFRWFLKKSRQAQCGVCMSALILSLMFAAIMLVGMSIDKLDSLEFVIGNKFQIMYSALLLFGYWGMFYVLIATLFRWLDEQFNNTSQSGRISKHTCSKRQALKVLLLDHHPLLAPMLLLLVSWLPYWLVYFPGSVEWDTLWQLNYFFGIWPWSDHHPVVSTLLYGSLVQLGRLIGSDSVGVFFCTLFQHILLSASLAYGVYRMKLWGVSEKLRLANLAFFALCPIVALWPSNVLKDCAFMAVTVFFGVVFIDLIRMMRKGQHTWKLPLFVVIIGIISALLRHNGLYVSTLALAVLAFLKIAPRKRIMCIVLALAVFFGTNFISDTVINALGATEGSVKEALSIPFQQTARYVKEYGDEVTEEERAAIDAVLQYDKLAEIYNPDLSDAVKNTYREDNAALSQYFKVWLKMFFKHPIVYIEATLNNSFSYYYPNGESTAYGIVSHGIASDPYVNTGFLNLKYAWGSSELRTAIYSGLVILKDIPGIGMLVHTGTYTWILLLACFYAIHRRHPYLLLGTAPAMLNLLICIASPVNGLFRYFMPTLLLTPIVVNWMISELHSSFVTDDA